MIKFGKLDIKDFGMGISVVFFVFQLISLILSNFFPKFAEIVKSYQLVWMWVILGLLVYFTFRLVHGMKEFDRQSIFIMFIAIAILFFIMVYVFKGDLGRLFDMSVIRSQMASIVPFT